MVEAAGVEPASEIVVNRETPCLVQFRKFAFSAQNGQETLEASPMILSLPHGPSGNNQPAVRRPLSAHRQR